MSRPRASDRWITPWVVCVLILAGTVVVLAVLAAVTYLSAYGYDPQPIVTLAGVLVGAATSSGNFLLNLAGRRTASRVERNTGKLGYAAVAAIERLEEERGRHAYPPDWPEAERGTAPRAAGRSDDLDQDTARASTRGPGEGPSYAGDSTADTPPRDLRDTAWFRQ